MVWNSKLSPGVFIFARRRMELSTASKMHVFDLHLQPPQASTIPETHELGQWTEEEKGPA